MTDPTPSRVIPLHPSIVSFQGRQKTATATTTLVFATLSAHAGTLPEHVIKAAAIAAGNATLEGPSE